MSQKQCRTCGEPIAASAARCQYCNSYQDWRRFTGDINLFSIVAIVTAVTSAYVGYQQLDSVRQNVANQGIRVDVQKEQLDQNESLLKASQKELSEARSRIDRLEAALSREISVPVVLTSDDIFFDRKGLRAFIREYIAMEPRQRNKVSLSIEVPSLAKKLVQIPRQRLQDPNLPKPEYDHVLNHVEGYETSVSRIQQTINEVLDETIRNAIAGDVPAALGVRDKQILSGIEVIEELERQRAQAITGRALGDLLVEVLQKYIYVTMRDSLSTIARANRESDIKTLGIDIPNFILKSARVEDVKKTYSRTALQPLEEGDFVEIEFGGEEGSTRIIVPKSSLDSRAREMLDRQRQSIQLGGKNEKIDNALYSFEPPYRSVEDFFSSTFWAKHAVWQIATRSNGGLLRKDYEVWGLP